MKYHLFIGRFQSPHLGHRWLINQKLQYGKPCLIMIRDVPTDDKNPFTAQEVFEMLTLEFRKEIDDRLVRIMVIPDIESVNYGRGVGYSIEEHKPPEDIKVISATEIRNSIRSGDDRWKSLVMPSVINYLEKKFSDG